jgi:hypothetical protein
MEQLLDEFTAYLQAQDLSDNTVDAFFTWLQEKIGADVPPVEVTPFDVQKYRDHLTDLGRKPATPI